MSTYYELQPAYGRDYKTKAEVTKAMHLDIARHRFLAWVNETDTEKYIEHWRKALDLDYKASIRPEESIAIDARVVRAKEAWCNGDGLDAALQALETQP